MASFPPLFRLVNIFLILEEFLFVRDPVDDIIAENNIV